MSVIVPAWNAAETIVRAVCSVLSTSVHTEVIVVDDRSTDDTVGEISKAFLNDDRVRIISQPKNSGVSRARNTGIKSARGKYVAFVDADDLWLEGKLELQLELIRSDQKVRLVTCDSLRITAYGEVVSRSHRRIPPDQGADAWLTLVERNFVPTPTVLVRRSDLSAARGFREDLSVAEDLDLWIRIAKTGAIAVVPDVLVHYVDYPGSLMKVGEAGRQRATLAMLASHLDAVEIDPQVRRRILIKRYVEFAGYSLADDDPERARTLFCEAERLGHTRAEKTRSIFKYHWRSLKSYLDRKS